MATDIDRKIKEERGVFAPSRHDQEMARASAELLSAALKPGEDDVEILLDDQVVKLPASAVRMLLDMLSLMARGSGVSIMPSHAELTTQQAADVLNVSRPYLVGLLEDGALPFRKVGTHRRVRFDDLMKYQEESQKERLDALSKLQADAQENDMGY